MAGYNNPMAFRMASADIFELMNTPYSGGSSSHTAAIGLCSLSFPWLVNMSFLRCPQVFKLFCRRTVVMLLFINTINLLRHAVGRQTPVTAIVNNKGGV